MTAIRKAGRELGLTQFGSRKGDRRASTTSTGPGRQASFGIKLRSRLQVKRTARAQPWQLLKQRRYNAETRRRPVRRARARIFVRLAEALAKSTRSLARTAAAPARSSKGSAAPKYTGAGRWITHHMLSSQGRKWTFSKASTVCPFWRPFSWPS